MAGGKAGRGSDQFPLRLPPGMRDQIKRAADDSGRSMNSEILEVLREFFPEEPSLEELVDEIDHSLALLREIQSESRSGDVTRSSKYLSVLGQLSTVNEELWKTIAADRKSPIIKLDNEVLEGIAKLGKEWDISMPVIDTFVNGLVQMSLDRIARGEENVKIWIGEGEARRMVELQPPKPDAAP